MSTLLIYTAHIQNCISHPKELIALIMSNDVLYILGC